MTPMTLHLHQKRNQNRRSGKHDIEMNEGGNRNLRKRKRNFGSGISKEEL